MILNAKMMVYVKMVLADALLLSLGINVNIVRYRMCIPIPLHI